MRKIAIAAAMLLLSLAMTSPALPSQAAPAAAAAVNPAAKYLLFQHNFYVESKGPDGDCKYHDILKSFRDSGFQVISEIRPKDSSVIEYGRKAAAEVRNLLAAGVPPGNITVAGHSKGGVIVLQAAAQLDNSRINYLVLAGCGIKGLEKGYPDPAKLKGRFLSLYATSDKVAGSCKEKLPGEEVALESGAGHQLFFAPADLWLKPALAWLKEGK